MGDTSATVARVEDYSVPTIRRTRERTSANDTRPGLRRDNRLVSREQGSGQEVARRVSRRLIVTALVANLSGALLVYALVTALLRDHDDAVHLDAFTIVLLAYLALGLALGLVWGSRRRAVVWGWLREDRDPDPAERERALRDPMRGLALMAALWGAAAVLFGVLEAADSGSAHDAVVHVGLTIALGGLATCAVTYLLSEWALRPVIARVLASGAPGQPVGASVGPRLLVGWALVTGVPVLGVAALAIGTLTEENHDIDSLAVSTLILAGSALIAGLVATVALARSLAQSIGSVRAALARIRHGDLQAQVTVDDSGEIGSLQAGFNEMAEGLRERERIREAFGTYVDRDVAEHILREGTSLAGEEVDVTVMFMDVRNFTAFAERASAPEVVATLNRLWERVVPVVHAHGGHVDKFVGDGLLAVFGAPRRQAHHADEALAAARAIERAAREDFAGTLEIGIGLNSGTVLAGNVGGGGRFEFSVFSPFTSRLRASQVKKRWLTPWKAPAPWPLIAAACTGWPLMCQKPTCRGAHA
jgi:adenylate cyclase